jgi:hypothetical protein
MFHRSIAPLAAAAICTAAPGCLSGKSNPADAGRPDAGPPDAGAPGPITAITFTLEQSFLIREAWHSHLAFPDVTRLRDGRILLVYREGESHQDSGGRIVKQFGSADGLSWTAPEMVYDEVGIDDRDPSVATLANGDVVVNYFQYRSQTTPSGTLTLHHLFFLRSTDDGATFGPLVQVDPGLMSVPDARIEAGRWVDGSGQPIRVQASSSGIVELGGEMVLPAYGGNALNLSDLAGTPRSRLSLFQSADGTTWTEVPVAPQLRPTTWLMEPALLALDDGTLLLHVRTASGNSPGSAGNLLQTTSSDSGTSWSAYRDLGLIGHAPELLQLRNTVVLSGFREVNSSLTQARVAFIYSLDRGASWSAPVVVRDCGALECGYPGLLELEQDRLLVVYYGPGGNSIDATIYTFEAQRAQR